jgi:sulfur-oxidizing protein SoxY
MSGFASRCAARAEAGSVRWTMTALARCGPMADLRREVMNPTRREVLMRSSAVAALMGGLGLLPGPAQAAWNAAAFDAKTPAEALKVLGPGAPVQSAEVTLTGPDIAENGAVVPVALACALPGVKRLMILVDKNPNALAAVFEVSDAVEPNFSTRVKMAQTSNVMAVAVMGDGKLLFAQKEIKVTLGGCGG